MRIWIFYDCDDYDYYFKNVPTIKLTSSSNCPKFTPPTIQCIGRNRLTIIQLCLSELNYKPISVTNDGWHRANPTTTPPPPPPLFSFAAQNCKRNRLRSSNIKALRAHVWLAGQRSCRNKTNNEKKKFSRSSPQINRAMKTRRIMLHRIVVNFSLSRGRRRSPVSHRWVVRR